MPQTTSRIVAGPLERFLIDGPDIYPNDATADLAAELLDQFRKMRSSHSCRDFPVLGIGAGGEAGHLRLVMQTSGVDDLLGRSGQAVATMIQLDFGRFTISEIQTRTASGQIERETVLCMDREDDAAAIAARIGHGVDAVAELPHVLRNVFHGHVVDQGRIRGIGTAYGFVPAA